MLDLVSNIVDSDQMTQYSASNLGLHCLLNLSVPVLRANTAVFKVIYDNLYFVYYSTFFLSWTIVILCYAAQKRELL